MKALLHPADNASVPHDFFAHATNVCRTGYQGRKRRVFVLEDHPFVRASLIQLLDRQPDLQCCGECDSALSAPFLIAERQPDLVLADLRLKHGQALDLPAALCELQVRTPVLILSHLDESIYAEQALLAGARGYLMKSEAPQQLLEAIRTVLDGGIYLSQSMSFLLRKYFDPRI